mmetsp:Transcript_77101/g.195720  ORF Transcript_77101/g.195720 Transcript_77101/m.195720 type:complete len:224 (+) Transcript_77101:71-742(+)
MASETWLLGPLGAAVLLPELPELVAEHEQLALRSESCVIVSCFFFRNCPSKNVIGSAGCSLSTSLSWPWNHTSSLSVSSSACEFPPEPPKLLFREPSSQNVCPFGLGRTRSWTCVAKFPDASRTGIWTSHMPCSGVGKIWLAICEKSPTSTGNCWLPGSGRAIGLPTSRGTCFREGPMRMSITDLSGTFSAERTVTSMGSWAPPGDAAVHLTPPRGLRERPRP